jgi:ribosomal protein S27AE
VPFTDYKETIVSQCPKCGYPTLIANEWESSDGGHTDYEIICGSNLCSYRKWEEGSDY